MSENKSSRLPSLRVRLLTMYIGTVFMVLVLSVTVLVALLYNVLGSYMENELRFVIRQTSDNLTIKLSQVEETLQRIRKDDLLMTALTGKGLDVQAAETAATRTALTAAADLYSNKNTSGLNMPFLDMVYLYDRKGVYNCTVYTERLSQEQAQLDRGYRGLYTAFVRTGNDVQVVGTEGHINVIFTVYNDWMEDMGTVIFALRKDAVQSMLEKMSQYPKGFWTVTDKHGKTVLGNADTTFGSNSQRTLSFVRQEDVYASAQGGMSYLTYTKPMPMGLCCVVGVPQNHLSVLIYQAALPYLAVTLGFALVGAFVLFLAIAHMTRPLREVAAHLREMAQYHFDVQLPPYPHRELNAISTAFNTMSDTIRRLIKDVYEKKLLAKDSEIKMLQSQINPHFMYNVLHTIAMKSRLDGNEEVASMVSSFAGLTRARISHNGDDKITLEQELQYVGFYLELQQYRFGEKLQYVLHTQASDLLQCLVPRLTVEMIVENAVVHGIEPKETPGLVQVDIFAEDTDLVIRVSDDGVGFSNVSGRVLLPLADVTSSHQVHNHAALNNAYKLLQHFYGPSYGISIETTPAVGTVVDIRIPKEVQNRDTSADCG